VHIQQDLESIPRTNLLQIIGLRSERGLNLSRLFVPRILLMRQTTNRLSNVQATHWKLERDPTAFDNLGHNNKFIKNLRIFSEFRNLYAYVSNRQFPIADR
jgi:hypothetical protein